MIDRESSTSEKFEEVEPEQEVADGKQGIFIRLSPDAKGILNSAKKRMAKVAARQRTYSGVIEKLLEYYRSQKLEVQTKILIGEASNPLKDAEDLLARLHRAQHAFETKRFYFAIKTYNAVADSLADDNSSTELMEVCHFRLAHCWNQLSYTLRTEALSPEKRQNNLTSELYTLALEAINVALDHLEKLTDGDDGLMAQIKSYNFACCHSVKAQYLVESKLDPKDAQMLSLGDARKDLKKTAELWEVSIGKDYLEENSEPGREAAKALDWLYKIGTSAEGTLDSPRPPKSSKTTSDRIWIIETAKEDSDLLFLHSAKGWKDLFDEWATKTLEGASIAEAINELLKEERMRRRR